MALKARTPDRSHRMPIPGEPPVADVAAEALKAASMLAAVMETLAG